MLKVTGQTEAGPRLTFPKPLGCLAPCASHHTSGSTCREERSPGASSVCSEITWTVEQSCRPSSSGKTANPSADFSNPWVKGALSGARAGLDLPANSVGAKNEIIPLITPGVTHFNSMNGVSLMNSPTRSKPSFALRCCSFH